MKKKLKLFLALGLLAILLTSCDEVLSIVSVDKDGEKVVTNYVSIVKNKVYDETISIKNWNEAEILEDVELDFDNLIFKSDDKKSKTIVVADEDCALEINFFDGGYKYVVFGSMGTLENSFNSLSNSLDF